MRHVFRAGLLLLMCMGSISCGGGSSAAPTPGPAQAAWDQANWDQATWQ